MTYQFTIIPALEIAQYVFPLVALVAVAGIAVLKGWA